MGREVVTRYFCDRPGCGERIFNISTAGAIAFSVSESGTNRVIRTPEGERIDLCLRCQNELVHFWFGLTK